MGRFPSTAMDMPQNGAYENRKLMDKDAAHLRGCLRSRTRIFLRIEQVYQAGLGSIRFSVQPLLRWLECNRSLGGGLGDYVLIVRAIYKWTRYGYGAATRDSLPLAEYLDGKRNCGQRTNANQRPSNRLALLGTKLVCKQERDARPKKSTCHGDETDFW